MPIGYTTYCAGTFEDLSGQQAQALSLEQSVPEGTLGLLELRLGAAPSPEVLADLNTRLASAGVPPWTGYANTVFMDTSDAAKVYITWTKGLAWTPVIIGIVVLLLPVIIGGILWFLIPQPVKDMITMMGMMALMMPLMGMVSREI